MSDIIFTKDYLLKDFTASKEQNKKVLIAVLIFYTFILSIIYIAHSFSSLDFNVFNWRYRDIELASGMFVAFSIMFVLGLILCVPEMFIQKEEFDLRMLNLQQERTCPKEYMIARLSILQKINMKKAMCILFFYLIGLYIIYFTASFYSFDFNIFNWKEVPCQIAAWTFSLFSFLIMASFINLVYIRVQNRKFQF